MKEGSSAELETQSYQEEDFLRYLGKGAPVKRTIDMPESRIEFYVSSSDGEVCGTFASWTGQLQVGAAGHPEVSTLNLEVSTISMTTGSGMKDDIIKGKDFFYVEKYPSITFTSTKVVPSGDPNRFQVQGEFTLRGVTKPVTLQMTRARHERGRTNLRGPFVCPARI
jgi:polyisoprenoid-binding protein YceI